MIRLPPQRPALAASAMRRAHVHVAPRNARPRSVSRLVAASLLLMLLATSGVFVSRASGQPSDRVGVPSLDEAEAQLELATARNSRAQVKFAEVELAFYRTQDAFDLLDARQADVLDQLAAARVETIDLAVASFIGGGEAVKEVELLLGAGRASDISWRRHLVLAQAINVSNTATNYSELAAEVDSEIHELAIEAQRAQVAYEAGRAEAENAAQHLDDVEALQVLALAWHRSDIAVAEGRYGEAPAANWERLRMCEATGNYGAISKSGIYRGAYQFDRQTWKTVGGQGDPAAAPALEQDARARELYARRGAAPWPVCGRFLP